MSKKFKTLIILCILALFSTGCVKYNVKMDIKKDKSLNYEIIYAIQSSLLEDKNVLEDDDIKKAKDEGYTVKEYNQDGYKGFIISKKIKNIDNVSDTNEVNFDISDNALKKDAKIFTVKKGLFKNTYKAKIEFDMSNSFNMDNYDDDDDDNTNDDIGDISFNNNNDVEVKLLDEKTNNTTDNIDMSQFTSSMDLKYTVNLPYKAKNNNATTVKNGGKQLEWNLTTAKSIEYEFELYNPIFYILIGIGAIIIICIIVIIIKRNKGNKKENNSTPIINNNEQTINNVPTMNTNNQVINNTPITNTIDNQTMNNGNINNTNNII